jgi:hypothetical protein
VQFCFEGALKREYKTINYWEGDKDQNFIKRHTCKEKEK